MRLRVDRLGHRGDGVAEGPGGRVLVAGGLPGEVVEGEVAGGRMDRPRILEPAPARVPPPCPHADACGGCALQHAALPFVTAWKEGVVAEALAARGLAARFLAPHVSPPRSRRRAVLAGRRTRSGVVVGLHGRASDAIVAVPGCLVLDPALLAALPAAAALVALGTSRRGALDLALTRSEAGVDVAVTGGRPADAALRAGLAGIARDADLARLSWEGEPVHSRAAPEQRFGAARVLPPPGAFLQATEAGEAALAASVAAAVGPARRVADLFAGCGTFALRLAATASVHAVEGSAAMVAALAAGARGARPGLRPLTAATRDLFRRPLLAPELAAFEAVVLDPPRAGAAAQAAALARSAVPVVAMVSCDPASFARDAGLLAAGGYRLDWVRVIDQFLWSPHVELVARLVRDGERPA